MGYSLQIDLWYCPGTGSLAQWPWKSHNPWQPQIKQQFAWRWLPTSPFRDFGSHTILNLNDAQETLVEMLAQKDHSSSTFLQSEDLNMLTALRISILHHKISDIFSSKILKDTINRNSSIEEASIYIIMLFQLAMASLLLSITYSQARHQRSYKAAWRVYDGYPSCMKATALLVVPLYANKHDSNSAYLFLKN